MKKWQRVGAGRGIGSVFMASIAALAACVGSDPSSDNGGGPDGGASSSGATSSSGTTGSSGTTSSSGASSSGASSSGAVVCTDASDVSSDPNNCGACGNKCPTGFGCSTGRCDNEVDDVAAGTHAACALLHGGKVYCWGRLDLGELGVEPTGSDMACGPDKCRPTPAAVPGITDAVSVAVGENHMCVAKKDGTVACWGNNDVGQLATSTATSHSATPLGVGLPVGTIVTQVSTQQDTTCARTSAGEVYCWGANEGGQVGRALSASEPTPNKVISSGATVVRVSANAGAHGHACALAGNNMYCWGSTLNGEGGGGYTDESPNVRLVYTGNSMPALTAVKDIAVAPGETCTLQSNGSILCFGSNYVGMFPPKSSTTGHNYPTQVSGLPLDGASIGMASYGHIFILTAGGDVWAWGIVDAGALGNGIQTGDACGPSDTFTCAAAVSKVTNLSDIKRIAPSRNFGIALRKDGKIVGWGSNDYANLGHTPGAAPDTTCTDTEPCTLTPTVIAGLP